MDTKKLIEKLEALKKDMPDLIIKKIKVGVFKYVYIISNETVSSGDRVNDFILKYFSKRSLNKDKLITNIKKSIEEDIPSINFKEVSDIDSALNFIFSGFSIVIYKDKVIAYETRADLDRGINEAMSEPVIRGPKDAFTENYNKNIGLIRKRIKSEYLSLKEVDIGKQTNTKVGMLYMSNIAEEELVNEALENLKKINIDGIIDVNNLKDYLDTKNKTLFPTILYSEKPDDACRYLLDGRIIITMENSPSVIIIPTFFVDFFQTSEDYYHRPFFATFMRIIRLLAFVLAICIPGLFIAFVTYDQQILPVYLLINFSEQRSMVPFPAIIEAFLLMFTFELLYEGDSRTPSTRGTSLSILGALVLGDAAVKAGLISPIMVIVISVSAISSLIFIYYDMQGSIRFWRYLLMIFSSFFGIIGFICGILLLIINLCSIECFNKPYLLPFSPLRIKDMANAILKRSITKIKRRPSYIQNNNVIKEDTK